MKLKDLENIFSTYTNVKLSIIGSNVVYEGYWGDVPVDYSDYTVYHIIPIRHPFNDNLGEASILLYRKYEE